MPPRLLPANPFGGIAARECGNEAGLEPFAMAVEQLGSSGELIIPGLVRLNVSEKPATPERQGVNPFTKQPMVFKAKPARRIVKAHPVKALKDAL